MTRLFSLLSAFAVVMVLTAGAGVFWISASQIEQTKKNAAETVARSVASSITAQINLLTDAMEKMTHDPDVVTAVTSADPALLLAASEKLEQHLPEAMKVRLLLPGVSELDDKVVPKMGYADLDMVRETFAANQQPAIQGDTGPDRHLAVTRRIVQNGQAVGVILASLQYNFIIKTVKAANIDGYLALKQDSLVLGSAGQSSEEESEYTPIKVSGTDWKIYYDYNKGTGIAELSMLLGVIAITTILTLLCSYVVYRKFSALLSNDIASVLKACKDLMMNKLKASYPIKLAEMEIAVSTLSQFKRVLDNEEDDLDLDMENAPAPELSMSHFLNDSDDFLSAAGQTPWQRETEQFVETKGEAPKTKAGGEAPEKINFAKQDAPETTVPDSFDMPMSTKKKTDPGVIFRAYDIRGVFGKTLTKEIVYDIGRALGTQSKEHGCKTVVIGRDGRSSSPVLTEALTKGIISTGLNALDIGMAPTPLLYFVARHTEGRSGVMITGSHNPAEYNGIKMVVNGETLFGEKIQHLKTCIDQKAFTAGTPGSVEQNTQVSDEYIGIISEDVRVARPMTVVLDCGNGVTGKLGPLLLKTLGCNVIELFCDIDGSFPNHHPDPSNPKNLTELITTVKHYKADIGIAFDGDGDRLGVVDSAGKIIWPDRLMMLFAKDVLTGKPGADIIYDVKCSRQLSDQIIKYGGRPTMWKTGHSLMKAKIKETGAKLAGEMSGHIFFNDRWFGFDDALYAAARLLEILSRDSRSTAEVFADYPDSINTPELHIELEEGENQVLMDKLVAAANFVGGRMTDIDGMRVDFQNGWGLIRASNTTPSLVARFEADSEAAMKEIQEQFKSLLTKVKPGIVLPF